MLSLLQTNMEAGRDRDFISKNYPKEIHIWDLTVYLN